MSFFDGEGLVSIFMRDQKSHLPETAERAAGRALWENRTRGVLDPKKAHRALSAEARAALQQTMGKRHVEFAEYKALLARYEVLCNALRMLETLANRHPLRSVY